MKKNILSQEYYQDSVTQRFVDYLENNIEGLEDSYLYYQYPIIREMDEEIKYPSLLIISQNHGVLLFKCNGINRVRDSEEIESLAEELSRIEDLLFSKLIKSTNKKMKIGKRELSFNLASALYLPNFEEQYDQDELEMSVLLSNKGINDFFMEHFVEDAIEEETIREIYSIIDNSTAIVKPKERKVAKEDKTSKAYILKKLEEEIANFDEEQKYAALSQLEGPQRIRGLAGSGKTIILCMKAAILHLKYPDKKILYTFMTKSLYDYIQLLITRFYKTMGDGNLPDFDNAIHVKHAWGGSNISGVYYDCCKRNNVMPINFSDAKRLAKGKDIFDFICEKLLAETKGRLAQEYDFVLIDEAQDFKPSFYQMCRGIVKDDCIVWGYDNLQNIFDVKMQNTEITFKNEFGARGINLATLQRNHPDMDNDIVLSKCYRNPREILVTAHALGFGIYNETLIQTLENNSHWEDHGYIVKEGNCVDGQLMVIQRPVKNSPLSISKYQHPDEIIELYSADNWNDECQWVSDSIYKAIHEDNLRPDDIVIISLDDKYAKRYMKAISDLLYEKGINCNNVLENYYQKGFAEDDCVTLSTVYKAKGHEAPMVFVVGCDVLEHEKNNRNMRNRVFTAFTRAKAWLKISGLGIEKHSIWSEVNEVKNNQFQLEFTYRPTHVIERDLDEISVKKAKLREIRNGLKKQGISEGELIKFLNEQDDDLLSDDEYKDNEDE